MNSELMTFTPTDVHDQVQLIQHLKQDVLKDGTHFGLVPGCGPKPALLKAGAEKLAFMFRLVADFIITKLDLGNGHREYEILVKFSHYLTGQYVGSGVGICSTMESKYRYRSDKSVDTLTDIPVPKAYWDRRNDRRNPPAAIELQAILKQAAGEEGRFGIKKDSNDQWVIVKRGESTGEKVENPDIADTYNTVIKMAKKRAFVDGVITCTAASDFFTQDIEELGEVEVVESTPTKSPSFQKITEAGNYSATITAAEIFKREGQKDVYRIITDKFGEMAAFKNDVYQSAFMVCGTAQPVMLEVEPNLPYAPTIKSIVIIGSDQKGNS